MKNNRAFHAQVSDKTLSVFRGIVSEDWEPDWHDFLLAKCLLVTFLLATKCMCHYEVAVDTFGLPRICEFFGFERDEEVNQVFVEFLRQLFEDVEKDCTRRGKRPSDLKSLRRYIAYYLLKTSQDHEPPTQDMVLTHMRLGTSSKSLIEVKLEGNDMYQSMSARSLREFLTLPGIEGLVRYLLNHPVGYTVRIGAGHKDDASNLSGRKREFDEVDTDNDILADCLKAVLILSSRDEDEKKRIEAALNDHEYHFNEANKLLRDKVRSIQFGKVYKGDVSPHAHAMTVNEGQWIAECLIEDSTRKHCVLIDANDGTISDPVHEGHGLSLPRNEETLKKLRIREMVELRPIIRFPLNKSTRNWLNKQCGIVKE